MAKCKFEKIIEQRYDNNLNQWIDTGNYKKGELLERNSPDCGYVPPTVNIMFSRTQKDGTYFEVKCGDSGTTLTAEIAWTNSNYGTLTSSTNPATAITIGNCVTDIANRAFSGWKYLTGTLTLPEGLNTIGNYAFGGCSGLTGNLDIPYTVASIGDGAFGSCSGFTGSLVIPDSVTKIGNNTFQDCRGFSSLTLPKNLTSIGYYAFQNCSGFTGSLTIPNSVTVINYNAFSGCTGFNGTLTLPKNLTTIGFQAFQNCSGFTGNLIIPNSVTSIDLGAFLGCTGLESITVNAITPPRMGASVFDDTNNCPIYVHCEVLDVYKSADGWKEYADRIQPIESDCNPTPTDTVMFSRTQKDGTYFEVLCGYYIGSELNSGLTCSNSSYDILTGSANPATAITIGKCVTDIADNTFRGWKYVTGTLTLPEGLKTIGESAFSGCSGLSGALIIPESVTDIEEYAFVLCDGLTSIIVKSAKPFNVGGKSFPYGSNDCPIYVPDDSLYEYKAAFGWDAYADRIKPMSSLYGGTKCKYQKIVREVFDYDKGRWVTTGEYKVGNLLEYDSPDCDTAKVRWITSTTEYICDDCEDEPTDTIMYSRTQKDGTYFEVKCGESGTTLTTAITCANSSGAILSGDTNPATAITIGNCVTKIDHNAFRYWGKVTGNLVIPDSVTELGDLAFYNCYGFNGTLTLSKNVTYINQYAFYGCSGFTGDLIIPDSVTEISYSAFSGCTGFNGTLTLSKNLQTIQSQAFGYCSNLTGTLTIPNSVTSIGIIAFQNCSGFTGSLVIPDKVTELQRHTFFGCSGFNNLTIGNNITSIGDQAFAECSGFRGDLVIPNKVTSIGYSAFSGCTGFNGELIIPDSIESIGNYTFYSCPSLSSIIVNATTPPTLGSGAFYSTNNCPIYVPDSSVDTYKTASGWSSYSSRIKPISEKT